MQTGYQPILIIGAMLAVVPTVPVNACEFEYADGGKWALSAQHYGEVVNCYGPLAASGVSAENAGQVLFGLAEAQRRLGHYDEAIAAFKRVLAFPVDDGTSDSLLQRRMANYAGEAQRRIGRCLFAQGDYGAAAGAFASAVAEHPIWTGCGTCAAETAGEDAFWQALCHEWNGDHVGAARLYWQTVVNGECRAVGMAAARLAALYDGTEQLPVLARIVDSYDGSWRADRLRRVGQDVPQARLAELLDRTPTRPIRSAVELYGHASREEWAELVAVIVSARGGGNANVPGNRQNGWLGVCAARLVARRPEACVPLLLGAVAGQKYPSQIGWVVYALAMCGTPQAVAALETFTRQATGGPYELACLIYCLDVAGPAGQEALRRLERSPASRRFDPLPAALSCYREQGPYRFEEAEPEFPPLTRPEQLPQTLGD